MRDYFIDDKISSAINETLINYSDGIFPISPFIIARNMGVKIITPEALKVLEIDSLNKMSDNSPALKLNIRGNRIIVVNKKFCRHDIRFSLAHEIGHIMLSHGSEDIDASNVFMFNRLQQKDYKRFISKRNRIDREADLFAVHLLAPPLILWDKNVRSTIDIENNCSVGYISSMYVSYKMQTLITQGYDFTQNKINCDILDMFGKYELNDKGLIEIADAQSRDIYTSQHGRADGRLFH